MECAPHKTCPVLSLWRQYQGTPTTPPPLMLRAPNPYSSGDVVESQNPVTGRRIYLKAFIYTGGCPLTSGSVAIPLQTLEQPTASPQPREWDPAHPAQEGEGRELCLEPGSLPHCSGCLGQHRTREAASKATGERGWLLASQGTGLGHPRGGEPQSAAGAGTVGSGRSRVGVSAAGAGLAFRWSSWPSFSASCEYSSFTASPLCGQRHGQHRAQSAGL